MTEKRCPVHGVAMEIVPAELRSVCPNCRFMTHHLHFDHCPRCGRRLVIEEPPPGWRCPECEQAEAAHGHQPSTGGRAAPRI